MRLIDIAPFINRSGFGDFLTYRGLTDLAVEVGTHRGEFADLLLRTWAGNLRCVDHYRPDYHPSDPAAMGNRTEDYNAARSLLNVHKNRFKFIVDTSEAASKKFSDKSVGFVYIDANHEVAEVTNDIHLWYPKLIDGGILAGHDIVCPGERDGGWGQYVQEAVFSFSIPVKKVVYLVIERDGSPWSWFIIK